MPNAPTTTHGERGPKPRGPKLSLGHDGHMNHCIFCWIHRHYRQCVPKVSEPRLTEEDKKQKLKKELPIRVFRRMACFMVALAGSTVLVYLTTPLLTRKGEFWQDNVLWRTVFIAACGPLIACIGFAVAGVYYMSRHYGKQKQKRTEKRARERVAKLQEKGRDAVSARPDSEATLISARYENLKPLEEVVVKPVTQPPRKRGWAEWLSDFCGKWETGYDGRKHRKSVWNAAQNGIEMSAQAHRGPRAGREIENRDERRPSRPITEWPVFG